MDVTMRQVRIFLTVVEHRSFTAAARSMHLSQSAVSRSTQELETAARTELLVRASRHLSLTRAGEEFTHLARSAVDSFDKMQRGFERYLLGASGGVHIAMLPSIAAVIIPPIAARFREKFPDVNLNIVDFLASDLDEYAISETADFSISFLPAHSGVGRRDARRAPDIRETPLLQDDLLVILPPEHPLLASEVVTWKQAAMYPLIATSPHSSTGILVDQTLSANGIDYQVHTQTRNIAAVGGIVSAGIGISLVPALALPLMSFGNFETRILVEPRVTRSLGIIGPMTSLLAPPAQRFREILLQAAKEGGNLPKHVRWLPRSG